MKDDGTDGSSAIAGHSYNPDTRKMRVTFKGKTPSTYEYDDVPLEKYAAFTGAASMGAFHNKKIKPNHVGRKVK